MSFVQRRKWASENLRPVSPKYCVIWEDPKTPDEAVKFCEPHPKWLASAMHGGILPIIDSYVKDAAKVAAYEADHGSQKGFRWDLVGGAEHPTAPTEGPMTQEQAMEYLVMKDLPQRVWGNRGNRQLFYIVPIETIPRDIIGRNALQLSDFTLESQNA